MSHKKYQELGSPSVITPLSSNIASVTSATGTDMGPMGKVNLKINLGGHYFVHPFLLCKHLHTPLIIGLDMQRKYQLGTGWTKDKKMFISQNNKVLVASVAEKRLPVLRPPTEVHLKPRSNAIVIAQVDTELPDFSVWESQIHPELQHSWPGITMPPVIHLRTTKTPPVIPLSICNHTYSTIKIPAHTTLAIMVPYFDCESCVEARTSERLQRIVKEGEVEINEDQLPTTPQDTRTVLSPADVVRHAKVRTPQIPLPEEHRDRMEKLFRRYKDIFSQYTGDIGHTRLLTMDIDTGQSPPLAEKPRVLPLKHFSWVKEELEMLEKSGIIRKSFSPWASPIVVVPKRSAEGEPPKKRLCVDYRRLNNLLPHVIKGLSTAKGVLSLIPLPKIDELYARLQGSKVYTSLDLTMGYHHIGLSHEAQKKSAFVTPLGKFEYRKVPFGLAQAPAYFQQLINHVLVGFAFCFGYLDDILVYSTDAEKHFQHLDKVFARLRAADLKLRKEKCAFFTKALHYLGHTLSGEGIQPLSDKIEAIENMPSPTSVTEIRQVLGLAGYYRKFIPAYADITRPMTNLIKKDVPFIWTPACEEAMDTLRYALSHKPVLIYPDPNLPYTLFTDASKYAWSGVLTQKQQEEDDKDKGTLHPIRYVSGMFIGSQKNWATLTKEAFAIFRSVTKLSFYLEDADIILRSDHLPLKKFLLHNTMNAKVNNWAIEMSGFRIQFEFIKGIKNTLADTLSRLIAKGITEPCPPEKEGEEFGYYVFDEPEDIVVNLVDLNPIKKEFELKITPEKIKIQQEKDPQIQQWITRTMKQKPDMKDYLFSEEWVLYKKAIIDDKEYYLLVVPRAFVQVILHQAHDALGHNATDRLYRYLSTRFIWKGMRADVTKHVKTCLQCRQQNLRPQRYVSLHASIPSMPMHFIAMDLIGNFTATTKGNTFGLTCIDMLTNYAWCVPIKNKTADVVTSAYLVNIFARYGGSHTLLTDNGKEFQNKLFAQVAKTLGMRHIFSSPYYPQGNGRMENFHQFLKSSIRKHVSHAIEWDDVTHLACAAYNFVPHTHSKEAPFFLMFGRDAITPLTTLLEPKIRYVGDERSLLALDVLRKVYFEVVFNLKMAREKQKSSFQQKPPPEFHIGDLVMLRAPPNKPMWDPKYQAGHRIVDIKDRRIVIRGPKGKEKQANIRDIKHQYPVDNILKHLPDDKTFGRAARYVAHPRLVEDLKWVLEANILPAYYNTKKTKQTPQPQVLTPKTQPIPKITKPQDTSGKTVTDPTQQQTTPPALQQPQQAIPTPAPPQPSTKRGGKKTTVKPPKPQPRLRKRPPPQPTAPTRRYPQRTRRPPQRHQSV